VRCQPAALAAHFAQMKDNTGGALPKIGVGAVVAAMEESGEITLEDGVKGRAPPGGEVQGGLPSRKEATEWARKMGWPAVNPAGWGGVEEKGRQHGDVAVGLGAGWEGATEGLRRV
jgi:hypothetical protein